MAARNVSQTSIVRMPPAAFIFHDPKLRRLALCVRGTCHGGADFVGMIGECVAAGDHVFEVEPRVIAPHGRPHRPHSKIADGVKRTSFQQAPFAQRRIEPTLQSLSRRALGQKIDQE
jgi:hypothetical protein